MKLYSDSSSLCWGLVVFLMSFIFFHHRCVSGMYFSRCYHGWDTASSTTHPWWEPVKKCLHKEISSPVWFGVTLTWKFWITNREDCVCFICIKVMALRAAPLRPRLCALHTHSCLLMYSFFVPWSVKCRRVFSYHAHVKCPDRSVSIIQKGSLYSWPWASELKLQMI